LIHVSFFAGRPHVITPWVAVASGDQERGWGNKAAAWPLVGSAPG